MQRHCCEEKTSCIRNAQIKELKVLHHSSITAQSKLPPEIGPSLISGLFFCSFFGEAKKEEKEMSIACVLPVIKPVQDRNGETIYRLMGISTIDRTR